MPKSPSQKSRASPRKSAKKSPKKFTKVVETEEVRFFNTGKSGKGFAKFLKDHMKGMALHSKY